jgi:hypothetical protein
MVEGGDRNAQGRPLVGYAISIGIVLAAVVAFGVLLAGALGDDDGDTGDVVATGAGASRPDPAEPDGDVLPDGGTFATPERGAGLARAAEAAGCELKRFPVRSRDHIANIEESVTYSSIPPTSGEHYPVPAPDGAYEKAPYLKTIVHSLEHSRVVVWFRPDLPAEARAALKAFFDADDDRMLLVPDEHGKDYEVTATAWNGKPKPNGTGRLLGCPEYGDDVFDALEAFKQRHRGKGPERIP